MFVYIMTRPCFDSVTSLIMLLLWRSALDGSADRSGDLREFKQIFLLISIQVLMKAITQCESVVTCIVVNEKYFKNHAVIITLVRLHPITDLSKIFSI